MSDIAVPDVSEGTPSTISVQSGLTGGEFGEGAPDDNTLSISALLAQSFEEGEDEPDEQVENPDEGTASAEADDNSEADSETDWKKQYEELQQAFGRMSNELGELRKAVSGESSPQEDDDEGSFPFPSVVTDEVRDEIEDAINTPGANPAELAAWAAVNRPDLYEAVLDVWAERSGADARRAAEFNFRYQQALQDAETTRSRESEQEFATQLEKDLSDQVATLAPEYGFEVGNEQHDTLLAAALSDSPKAIQDLVVSRDSGQREAGLRAVLAMAVVKGGVTTPAADGAANEALATAQAVAKGAASIGGGGLKPAAAPTPVNPEQAIEQAIASRLLNRPSTSVSEGLTGGQFSR